MAKLCSCVVAWVFCFVFLYPRVIKGLYICYRDYKSEIFVVCGGYHRLRIFQTSGVFVVCGSLQVCLWSVVSLVCGSLGT